MLVLLDACRDKPHTDQPLSHGASAPREPGSRSISNESGSPGHSTSGMPIGFATLQDIAPDGDADHSPFTPGLLRYLEPRT
jgi:hypothetical protein